MKEYYYFDIDLSTKKIVALGKTNLASLSPDTEELNIFRFYLTKGQFNKLSVVLERNQADK